MPTYSAHFIFSSHVSIFYNKKLHHHKMPIIIKHHKKFEPSMPKVPTTQLRTNWALPTKKPLEKKSSTTESLLTP